MEEQIIEALSNFWDESVIELEDDSASYTYPMDSLIAVEALIILDKITGIKLPEELIENGGYDSKEQFVSSLNNAVLDYVKRQEHV